MFRELHQEEIERHCKALQSKIDSVPSWKSRYNPDDAISVLKQGLVNVVVIDESYLLFYCIVSPWYNAAVKDFCELGVFKIAGHSSFAAVVRTMQDIAQAAGATRILVGTSLATEHEALARLYRRQGFIDNAMSLYKEV